jgi:hypothetical protein
MINAVIAKHLEETWNTRDFFNAGPLCHYDVSLMQLVLNCIGQAMA